MITPIPSRCLLTSLLPLVPSSIYLISSPLCSLCSYSSSPLSPLCSIFSLVCSYIHLYVCGCFFLLSYLPSFLLFVFLLSLLSSFFSLLSSLLSHPLSPSLALSSISSQLASILPSQTSSGQQDSWTARQLDS